MLTTAKSAETWQALLELRCKREIIERWLANQTMADGFEQILGTMLREVDEQLQLLANTLSR